MALPKVTVICLCYNQARFVKEAIVSVLTQNYPEIQLIVVDDASTDNSVDIINDCLSLYPGIRFLALPENVGNCRAFNQGAALAKGDFIIDLAADDILLPDRIRSGVMALSSAGHRYGVNFCDAEWVTEDGRRLYRHSDRFPHDTIPQGDVYKELIARFFICSPAMIFRREVISTLGGYDETLSYEDFDFWIRSSRNFFYCYTPEVHVKKRVVRHSMSQKQFSVFSPQLRSTFRVCEKIMELNRSAGEQKALGRRILYEIKVCLRSLNVSLAAEYVRLYLRNARLRY